SYHRSGGDLKRHRTIVLGTLVLLIIASVALLGACGGGKSNPMSSGATADIVISITGVNGPNSYSPRLSTIKVGKTVAWRNNAGGIHTATADHGEFDTGNIASGSTSAPIPMGTQGVVR